ncbi:MAG: DNA-directed RNA polymerase subunit H [Thermoplasmata archaeon]
MGKINVMKHTFVPEHGLVPKEDEKDILLKLNVSKDKLPKILKSDPVLQQLEGVEGKIEEGRMVEIIRKSSTAGEAYAYRLVVNR